MSIEYVMLQLPFYFQSIRVNTSIQYGGLEGYLKNIYTLQSICNHLPQNVPHHSDCKTQIVIVVCAYADDVEKHHLLFGAVDTFQEWAHALEDDRIASYM